MQELNQEVTQIQRLGLKKMLRDLEIEDNVQHTAVPETLQAVLELHKQSDRYDITEASYINCFTFLSAFFPPAGAKPNDTLLTNIENFLVIFAPAKVHKGNAEPVKDGQGQNITVVTADEKEKAERWRKMGGVRAPRRCEAPWNAVYPHPWMEMLATMSVTTVGVAWESAMDHLFHGKIVPEHLRAKHRRLIQQVQLWFEAAAPFCTKNATNLDVAPTSLIKQWYLIAEQIPELLLLSGTKVQAPLVQVTIKYNNLITARWSSGEPLDFYKIFTEAAEVKAAEPPKPSHHSFRRL